MVLGLGDMSRIFEINLSEDPGHVISRAREAAQKNRVAFEGNDDCGTFHGHGIKGHYRIEDHRLHLEINKKPLIMPWTLIESTIRGFFEKQS